MITGRKAHFPNSGTSTPQKTASSDDLLEEEYRELVKMEARQFFEDLMRKREGRTQFLKWLFHLTDTDHNETIGTAELGNILDAVSEDGIMPEDLSFDQLPESGDHTPHNAAKNILDQYDTGHYGFLTRDEFMVLADLILKNYELMPDSGENHVGKYILKRKLGHGASGVVWLAFDSETKVQVAIKVIHKGDVSDMARVDCEIKVIRQICRLK
jgi:Ca2+-binding EF-hand superfamily protein